MVWIRLINKAGNNSLVSTIIFIHSKDSYTPCIKNVILFNLYMCFLSFFSPLSLSSHIFPILSFSFSPVESLMVVN